MRTALAEELRRRLPERAVLNHAHLIAQFWPALPESDLRALFALVEQEFTIPAGMLRPNDDLDQLLAPLSIRRPLWWFRVEPALEDATSELSYQLARRLKASGHTVPKDFRVRTFNDLVLAWCGLVREVPQRLV